METTRFLRRRWALLAAMAATLLAGLPHAAWSQDYPSRAVTLVSPYPPGSGSDHTARAIAPFLKEALGQTVIVDNRAGAGGSVGARSVARAQPDGYTLLLGSISFSVLPALANAGYDPVGDFEAVGLLGVQQMALLVPADLGASSMEDLVKLAKAQPGKLNYASAGTGSIGHLQFELFKHKSGARMVHIPFSGTPQVLSEVVAGRVQAGIVAVPTALPLIKDGKVKALAVEGDRRAPGLPGVPTMDEAGYPELRDGVWYILLVPKGTPRPVVERLNAALVEAVAQPEAVQALQRAGMVPAKPGTPEEASRYLRDQVAKWRKVVADAGVKKDDAK